MSEKASEIFRGLFVAEKSTNGSSNGFADAVTVWINKPHVVNRRLCGSKVISYETLNEKYTEQRWKDALTGILSDQGQDRIIQSSLTLSSDEPREADHHIGGLKEVPSLSVLEDGELMIIVRELIPKNTTKFPTTVEVVLFDRKRSCVLFRPVVYVQTNAGDSKISRNTCQGLCYQLQYQGSPTGSKISLSIQDQDTAISSKEEESSMKSDWLKDYLLPKIANWSAESKLKTSVTSLRLVPVDKYNTMYNNLKEKYGKKLVQIWPEKTDPQKFVYEDVAIATYLLLLWEKERQDKSITKKQSFVDLGCGNGLLVYILSAEGHPGVGLDVRKRNIWDLYKDLLNGSSTVLKEKAIVPSIESLFPEFDWLIGNHSDELTPWIPVMASRTSYSCRYFVLPCCHHDFDCKFSAKMTGASNYRSYLDFICEVGEKCGFSVQEDTLRIPSTKRVCFIGSTRNYSDTEEAEAQADKVRTEYIKSRCQSHHHEDSDTPSGHCNHSNNKKQKLEKELINQWSENFKPRDKVEKSRNCKNVKPEIKEHIIHTVFTKVLDAEKAETKTLADGRRWRKGGMIPLSEVVKLFDKEVLQELKSECGGLQTLLRNHNSVFNVSGGNVQLRDLTLDKPYSKKSKLSKEDKLAHFKTIMCWFYSHHPDGCPLTAESCTFAHGSDEIRKSEFNKPMT